MRVHELPEPRRLRSFLLPVLLAAAAFLFTALGGPGRFRAEAVADGPLTHGEADGDRVALTFDVTWGRAQLDQILATLEQNQVKATFFVGGTFLGLYPEAVRSLADGGHEVASLGQRMVDVSALPELEVTSNLLASQAALSRTLGAPVRFFRPPYGEATPAVVRAARAAGMTTATQSIDASERDGITAHRLARAALLHVRRGSIIRLSASDWAPETAKALPEILQGLKAKQMVVGPLRAMIPEP